MYLDIRLRGDDETLIFSGGITSLIPNRKHVRRRAALRMHIIYYRTGRRAHLFPRAKSTGRLW